MRIRWISETQVAPARALATTRVLSDEVAAGKSAPVVIYGASVDARALVLGQFQEADQAVNYDEVRSVGVDLLRRLTGGPTAWLEPGVVYLSICLRNASSLMECPPTRVLNRNVRGVLGGLAQSGAAAHYFGREWISVEKRPVALVGWDRHPEGSVTLEFFLGDTANFAPPENLLNYPDRTEPRFRGKKPIALKDVMDEPKSIEELVRAIAEGHVDRYAGEYTLEHSSLGDDEREQISKRLDEAQEPLPPEVDPAAETVRDAEENPARSLKWSKTREVPIGFVSAGIAKDGDGLVTDVQVAGDFFQDREAPELLRAKLVGKAPEAEALVDAINQTWDMKRVVIEGLSELDPILKCLMEVR